MYYRDGRGQSQVISRYGATELWNYGAKVLSQKLFRGIYGSYTNWCKNYVFYSRAHILFLNYLKFIQNYQIIFMVFLKKASEPSCQEIAGSLLFIQTEKNMHVHYYYNNITTYCNLQGSLQRSQRLCLILSSQVNFI